MTNLLYYIAHYRLEYTEKEKEIIRKAFEQYKQDNDCHPLVQYTWNDSPRWNMCHTYTELNAIINNPCVFQTRIVNPDGIIYL